MFAWIEIPGEVEIKISGYGDRDDILEYYP